MAAPRLSRSTRIWLVIAAVAVALLAAAGGSYMAVNAGGSPAAVTTATPDATPTSPFITVTPPQATATVADPPLPSDTVTPDASLPPDFPPVQCGGPRYHLNIQKLRDHPNLAGAVVTEINQDTVRIDIDGVDFLITGWGGSLSFGGYAPSSDELFEQVVSAAHAVRYEC